MRISTLIFLFSSRIFQLHRNRIHITAAGLLQTIFVGINGRYLHFHTSRRHFIVKDRRWCHTELEIILERHGINFKVSI